MNWLIIHKLFGTLNYKIDLSKHCTILIGENGSGKSTILRMIKSLSDFNFCDLSKIRFEKIELISDYKRVTIEYFNLMPQLGFDELLDNNIYSNVEKNNLVKIFEKIKLELGPIEWAWLLSCAINKFKLEKIVEEKIIKIIYQADTYNLFNEYTIESIMSNAANLVRETEPNFQSVKFYKYSFYDKSFKRYYVKEREKYSINEFGLLSELREIFYKVLGFKNSVFIDFSKSIYFVTRIINSRPYKKIQEMQNQKLYAEENYSNLENDYEYEDDTYEEYSNIDENDKNYESYTGSNNEGIGELYQIHYSEKDEYYETDNSFEDEFISSENIKKLVDYKETEYDYETEQLIGKINESCSFWIKRQKDLFDKHNSEFHMSDWISNKISDDRILILINQYIKEYYFDDNDFIMINDKLLNHYQMNLREESTANMLKQHSPKFEQLLKFFVDYRDDLKNYMTPIIDPNSKFSIDFDQLYFEANRILEMNKNYKVTDTSQIYFESDLILTTIHLSIYYFFLENFQLPFKNIQENNPIKATYKYNKFDQFKDMISDYLYNKNIEITPSGMHVYNENMIEIDINNLSSGEKKIIALVFISFFAGGTAIIIDEPEISISLYWQKKILFDIQKHCKLIVVTHSPFFLENKPMSKYIQPLNHLDESELYSNEI